MIICGQFEERRLRCSIIQLKLWQQQQQKQQQEIPFVYGQNIAFEDKIKGYPHIHSEYMIDNEIGMVDKDMSI